MGNMNAPTAVAGGSGPLHNLSITPYLLGNAAPRAFQVDLVDGLGHVAASTGLKLGKSALIVAPAGTYTAKAATKDCNGIWSEASSLSVTLANYTAGTTEGSIGSGAPSDYLIQNPGVEWPDFSIGSGTITIRKTLVSTEGPTFFDEARTSRWNRSQAVFHLVMTDLDQAQSECLQRFFRAVNGPQRPFLFDWFDPAQGSQTVASPTRHLVRFRDQSLVGKTQDVELTSYDMYLVEVIEDPEGGNA